LNPGTYYIIAASSTILAVQGACPTCVTKTIAPNTDLIQNGAPDGLRIMNGGVFVDGLHYEGTMSGIGEGSSAPTDTGANSNQSIGRCPNGFDSDDNGNDFVVMPSTPGAPNICP